MDFKLPLIVVATLLTIAAAAPHAQNYGFQCQNPPSVSRSINLYGTWTNLALCSQPGTYLGYCINVKRFSMKYCRFPQISDCTQAAFYQYGQRYYVGVCNEPYGQCFANGNVPVCGYGLQVNEKLAIQKALEDELECLCVKDDNGNKVCSPEHCDKGEEAKESGSEGCFCVDNKKGNKVCTPAKCDEGEARAEVDDDDCFCIQNDKGGIVCEPPRCDTEYLEEKAHKEEDQDCFCVKSADGRKVCEPRDCDQHQ